MKQFDIPEEEKAGLREKMANTDLDSFANKYKDKLIYSFHEVLKET